MSRCRSRRGGRREGQDREPMIEILAEPARARRGLEVEVGRGDDPDVHRLALGRAQAPDRALLQHREQLGLEPIGQEADLVQEQRAPVGGLEQPSLRLAGVREGAPLEPEHLRLEQGLGNRRAVDVDEGSRRLAGPARWSARATSPLPLPVSPWIRTGGRRRTSDARATRRAIRSRIATMPGLSPTSSGRSVMVRSPILPRPPVVVKLPPPPPATTVESYTCK